MYFVKKKNKRYLFLQGNLILSHNEKPVSANVNSAAPALRGGVLIQTRVAGRIRATRAALAFIWGPNRAMDHGPEAPLTPVVTELKKG